MRHSIFSVLAVLTLLVATPALAQQEKTGTEIQPYETRTNPDAGSITGQSGLTLTGTVVEWNDEQLTLHTTTGIEHIQIVPDTQHPVELTAGEDVSVDYTRTSQGVMIAQKIRTQGSVAESNVDVTTRELATDTEPMDESMGAEVETETQVGTGATMEDDFDTDADLSAQADVDAESDLDTEADLDTTMDDQDSLPATGSELPLVGLLGLLSVAAAVGVRSYLR